MEATVFIEKTDVKIYEVKVPVDMSAVTAWVDEKYGSHAEQLDDDSETDVTQQQSPQEYYQSFIEDYLQDADPDLLFTDNCLDHQRFEFESEECALKSVHVRGAAKC